jgi:predicted Rdx family selenoprotein
MAEAVVTAFRPVIGQKHPIVEVCLVPSSGGRFEVSVDEELVFSKAATHQHTTDEYIIGQVRARMK